MNIDSKSIFFIIVLFTIHNSWAARILAIYSTPSPSHHMVFHCYTEELAKRGHELVLLTTHPHRGYPPDSNIRQIDVGNISSSIWKRKFNRGKVPIKSSFKYQLYAMYKEATRDVAEAQLKSPEMRRLLRNETEHFDLIIVQNFIPLMMPVAARFKSPLVTISSSIGFTPDYTALGNPLNPIYYPDTMNTYTGKLNFMEKIDALCYFLWERCMDWMFASNYDRVVKKNIGYNSPTIGEVMHRSSISLMNIHPIIAGIRPVVPALVNLGAINLKPCKALPQGIKKYLDDSNNGVIYMSLGSNSKSTDLCAKKIKTFVKVFGQLPYNIIWKWENDTFEGKPANVWISKWLPQQDILGHPNVRAFITHGGLHSLDEAIHNKIPLVGIPFVIDQYRNVRLMEELGIGVGLDINTVEEESLMNALVKVMDDKSYSTNVARLSAIMKDQANSGMKRAIWWTEYVIRNKGAIHLSAPKMSLWQYLMLDVISFMLAVIALPVLALNTLHKYLSRHWLSVKSKPS